MNPRKRTVQVFVLLVAATMAACGDPEDRIAAHLERGKALFEETSYQKARLEFKNVLQIDPKHVEAWYFLGQVQQGQ